MTSLIARCAVHASVICRLRAAPIPSTSRSLRGVFSMTASVSMPNFFTRREASFFPTPFTRPEPR